MKRAPRKDRTLQKLARVVAVLCYLVAVICAVFWYFKRQELGATHPVSASFLASMFFFAMVGFLLGIMGNADIPDLRVRSAQDSSGADPEDRSF